MTLSVVAQLHGIPRRTNTCLAYGPLDLVSKTPKDAPSLNGIGDYEMKNDSHKDIDIRVREIRRQIANFPELLAENME